MAFIAVQVDASPSNVLPSGRAGASFTVGTPVYLDSNGVYQKAAASAASVAFASRLYAIGFVWKIVQANEVIEPLRKLQVRDTALSLTVGAPVFLSATAGALTQTAPASGYVRQTLGNATSAYEYALNSNQPDVSAYFASAAQALITVGAGSFGMDSAANVAAIAAMVLEIRSNLISLGIWKGAA